MPSEPEGLLGRLPVRLELALELLRRTGHLRMRATGSSMMPAIFPGELLLVTAAPAADLQTGDIALAACGGRMFVHRVVSVCDESVVLRGDRHEHADPPLPPAAILGRVTHAGERALSRLPAAPWAGWALRQSDLLACAVARFAAGSRPR